MRRALAGPYCSALRWRAVAVQAGEAQGLIGSAKAAMEGLGPLLMSLALTAFEGSALPGAPWLLAAGSMGVCLLLCTQLERVVLPAAVCADDDGAVSMTGLAKEDSASAVWRGERSDALAAAAWRTGRGGPPVFGGGAPEEDRLREEGESAGSAESVRDESASLRTADAAGSAAGPGAGPRRPECLS